MILNDIYISYQPVNNTILKEAMIHCYNNICFSTFPYIDYNTPLSKDTITKYNSGNCIAMSYFVKGYLKNNYNIDSQQIVASVPEHFRIKGQDELCHVALFICKSNKEFYIVDPAFYFLDPIHIKDDKEHSINTYNIHEDKSNVLYYSLNKCTNENILPNSFSCKCYFRDYPNHKYEYIFNEIMNPDDSIGKSYHSIKKDPFLLKTEYENNIIKKIYHLKKENDQMIVIHNYKVIPYNYKKLYKDLYKYLDPNIRLH
ncbi:hypothetical protein 162300202 [Organic Lake phycodnavirus 2]|jgi:hypothetical protein|nr:hypothetical protein 162300202 [Organic Lake phycodnavirus 2]